MRIYAEWTNRVRRLQRSTQSHHGGSALRDRGARIRIQETGRAQSEQARSKAEAETRFPRPVRLVTGRFRPSLLLPDQLVVGYASSDDLGKNEFEAVEIVCVSAIIEAECLFVNIGLQVRGIDADVGSLQSALEQAPEILHAVGMYAALNVALQVIHKLTLDLWRAVAVDRKLIGVQFRSGFNVVLQIWLNVMLGPARRYGSANVPVTLKQSEHDSLVPVGSRRLRPLKPFRLAVHVGDFSANEGFVRFDLARQFVSVVIHHRQSDTVEHEPRGLLGDAKIASDFE